MAIRGIVSQVRQPKSIAHRWKFNRKHKGYYGRDDVKRLLTEGIKIAMAEIGFPGKVSIDPNDRTRLNVEINTAPVLHECQVTFKVPQ